MRDFVELNELYPLIKEVIESGGEFKFYPRGISMEPLLHQGDDSVVLGAADSIKTGDVVFYKRDNGSYVLHRIMEKFGGTYTMCGDHQNALEYPLRSLTKARTDILLVLFSMLMHSLPRRLLWNVTFTSLNSLKRGAGILCEYGAATSGSRQTR